MRTLIIGGGISGLTRAWHVMSMGQNVDLWEARSEPGGAIRTILKDSFLLEAGPNSLQNSDPRITSFLSELGLSSETLTANRSAAKRYIFLHGRPVPTPNSIWSAITSPLLSFSAKMRILREPWVPKRSLATDESLGDMVERRLGTEPLENLINPMVGGIYAGNPHSLSVRHAFPKLWNLEQEHGSFIRGAMKKRATGPKNEIISFRDGLQTLPNQIAASLGDRFKANTSLETLEFSGKRFLANGLEFDRVIITSPPHTWPTKGVLANRPNLSYAPVVSVSLGFVASDIEHPIDGFGMLIPEKERRDLLGVLFPSAIFPNRAPEGHHLLTCFIGGSRQPHLTELDDTATIQMTLNECRNMLGVKGEPVMTHITRWKQAIPQYGMNFSDVLTEFESLEARYPGLSFLGNFRNGIGLDKCIIAGLA
jgi:oxygen-dependent protoporphyrinogen oxidase